MLEWGLSPAQASGRTLPNGQRKVAMPQGPGPWPGHLACL